MSEGNYLMKENDKSRTVYGIKLGLEKSKRYYRKRVTAKIRVKEEWNL